MRELYGSWELYVDYIGNISLLASIFYYFIFLIAAFTYCHVFTTCLFTIYFIWYFTVPCNHNSFPLSYHLEKQGITAVLTGCRRLFSIHSSVGSSAVRCRKNIYPARCAQGVSATSGRCHYPGGRRIFR